MTKKPIVLIPINNPPLSYVNALERVNLDCVCQFSPENLKIFSGLLLTGGGDVLSAFYNADVDCQNVNVLRDVNEFTILNYFIANNLPVLGICRGLQVINVFLGGNLKNVCNHNSSNGDDVFHRVNTKSEIFERLSVVNSNHRQSVDKLFSTSVDVLTSTDGFIEGFSTKNLLAVQFHPERMESRAISIIYGEFAKRVNFHFKKR